MIAFIIPRTLALVSIASFIGSDSSTIVAQACKVTFHAESISTVRIKIAESNKSSSFSTITHA